MDMVNAVLTAVTKFFLQKVNIFGQCQIKLEIKLFFKNKICLPQNGPMGGDDCIFSTPAGKFPEKNQKFFVQ